MSNNPADFFRDHCRTSDKHVVVVVVNFDDEPQHTAVFTDYDLARAWSDSRVNAQSAIYIPMILNNPNYGNERDLQ